MPCSLLPKKAKGGHGRRGGVKEEVTKVGGKQKEGSVREWGET